MSKLVSKVKQARLNYQARIGRIVSVREIAEQLGTTRSYLSLVENGKAWPRENIVAGLCKIYGIKVEDLYSYDENQDPNEDQAK